ncbi:MAG: hypothetical protein ACYSR9_00045 [Planctomycetota bacterium]|jgi:hypothetical protein
MKRTDITVHILFVVLLSVVAGCGSQKNGTKQIEQLNKAVGDCNEAFAYASYASSKINIMPLTEYIGVGDAKEESKIKAYVSLLDSFGYQIRSPGTFRFELYEKAQRSAEQKGKRISIWPDIDLTDIVENNRYWRDFLRAYEFSLPVEVDNNQSYILQATCICPNGKRLSTEYALLHSK